MQTEPNELTRKMIAWTEFLLFSSIYPVRTAERRRVLRINEYLCRRYNRHPEVEPTRKTMPGLWKFEGPAGTPEEREVFQLIEYGGEG